MGEIATRGMIRNMFSTFPTGNDAECLTKQELLSGSGNLMIISGGDTECVPLEAISFKPYPCKSQTDKAPLLETDYSYLQECSYESFGIGHVLHLANNATEVYVTMIINGTPQVQRAKLDLDQVRYTSYYGASIFRGGTIEMYGTSDPTFLITGGGNFNFEFRFEIDGNITVIKYNK